MSLQRIPRPARRPQVAPPLSRPSPAPRLRAGRGMDGLMADQAGWILGMHDLELARNLNRPGFTGG